MAEKSENAKPLKRNENDLDGTLKCLFFLITYNHFVRLKFMIYQNLENTDLKKI